MKTIKRVIKRILPRIYWKIRLSRNLLRIKHENEMVLIPVLSSLDHVSIDIGASSGIYSVALLAYSKKVYSFEPRLDGIRDLIEMTQSLGLPIQVEAVAISNREGEAELRMLKDDLGRSTIAPENALLDPDKSPEQRIVVLTKTLDSYSLEGAGFIKIDVEGHEMAVLQGAVHTIEKNRCNLLIEMEERHCPGVVCEVKAWLEQRGYVGLFLDEGEILPMEIFDSAIHQNPKNIGGWKENWIRKGKYINNFIFVPAENKNEFVNRAKRLTFPLRNRRKQG